MQYDLTRLGIRVPFASISDSERCALESKLTVSPIKSDYEYMETTYKVFTTSTNNMYVPRFFFGPPTSNMIKPGKDIFVAFNGNLKLSTEQPQAANAILQQLEEVGGCILSLPTGFGKTTVALYVLAKMKVKTLIVVHKEFLMQQWIEKIEQFLPDAKVGRIQGSTRDVEGKDIVIGMLQSLSMKTYDRSLFDEFGFTIIDETHHVCTKTFSKIFSKFNTKYILGLSATLNRTDGLTHVLHWFLGNIGYHTERKNQSNVIVRIVDYRPTMPFPMTKQQKPNMSAAVTLLSESEERNILLMTVIEDLLKLSDRKILLLTDRRQHCLDLLEMCTQKHGETCCGLYMGGMKNEELKRNEKKQIIIGTYSLAHEGLDIPSLDTIILATPKSNIVQAVGRILRETTGKLNDPYVIDFIDHWGPIQYQFRKRKKYYTDTGFTFQDTISDEQSFSFIKE
jgi:superfamily II DNA or RNA helicase